MGSGRWSPATYNDRAVARAKTGTDAFDYSRAAVQSGFLRAHQTLDPMHLGMARAATALSIRIRIPSSSAWM